MKKILIVDDDKDLLFGLRALLTNKGYEIKTISDGDLAPKALVSFAPDLIVLDVHMGKSDGRQICLELKSNAETRHIPILMISADEEGPEISRNYRADDFIAKPLSLVSLYNKVESLIA